MHTTYNNKQQSETPELKELIETINQIPQELQLQICLYLMKKIGYGWFDQFKLLAEALPYGWQKKFVTDYNKGKGKGDKINPMTITRLVKGDTVNLNKELFDGLFKFARKELKEQMKVKEGIQKIQNEFLIE